MACLRIGDSVAGIEAPLHRACDGAAWRDVKEGMGWDGMGQRSSASTASANSPIDVKVQSGVTSAGGAGVAPQPGLA